MQLQRRLLPSTRALVAFDAVARLGSFTAAARELDLTQGAISRQIQALEDQLGVLLVERDRHSVRLTPAGDTYADAVRSGLRAISAASLDVISGPDRGALNLAILPTFGTRWLAPRIPAFLADHPGITINLSTRLRPFDFSVETLDAAIHHGPPEWPGAECIFLMQETEVPACAPSLLTDGPMRQPADLLNYPLLHIATRPYAWPDWFADAESELGASQGMSFDQFSTVAQAAVAGLGIALLPRFLIEDELKRGDLVIALDRPVASRYPYYLAIRDGRAQHPHVAAFRDWLVAEASHAGLPA
ncbi:MAG: LysR family transcriptional regulator [Rhodospirillales bacterium]